MELVSRRSLAILLSTLSCVTACVTSPAPASGASPGEADEAAILEVAKGFVSATRARRFDVVWELLSERWRARVTAGRLAADFDLEPLAEERVRRVERSLSGRPRLEGQQARLPVGPGTALVLVREDGGWRVDALE